MNADASQTSSVWDFFIAHAGPDIVIAERLFSQLQGRCRPFLASKSLRPGDAWDAELAQAQTRARVTLILISTNTLDAYYQREEIARAIAMAREGSADRHRVVPIFLPGTSATDDKVPYGLRLRHGVAIASEDQLPAIADRLLELLNPEATSAMSTDATLSADEADVISELFKYKGLCKIGAAQGEHECLWMPGFLCDMQWGWERLPEYAKESGKTIGSREERLRWIFVVRDLVNRGLLQELPKDKPRHSTYYELTEQGWRTGLALSLKRQGK